MTTLTDMTARNPLNSVRECGFNCVEPVRNRISLNMWSHAGKRKEEEKGSQFHAVQRKVQRRKQ